MKNNSRYFNGLKIKSLVLIFLITVVSASWLSSLQPENFFFGLPLYIGHKRDFSYRFVVSLFLAATIAICLLPIPFIGKSRKYLIIGSGMYMALGHLLAPFHDLTIFLIISWLVSPVVVLLAGAASFLSMNEKFEGLFLSFSTGYIFSVILFRFFGLTGGILYIITFLIFFVVLQILKKPLKNSHGALCKAAILAYAGFVAVDTIPTIFMISAIMETGNVLHRVQRWIFYIAYPIVCAILFVIIGFKKLIKI